MHPLLVTGGAHAANAFQSLFSRGAAGVAAMQQPRVSMDHPRALVQSYRNHHRGASIAATATSSEDGGEDCGVGAPRSSMGDECGGSSLDEDHNSASARPSTLSAAETTMSVGSSVSERGARGSGSDSNMAVEKLAAVVLDEAREAVRLQRSLREQQLTAEGEECINEDVAAMEAAVVPVAAAPPAATAVAPPPAPAPTRAAPKPLAALFGRK